jgi:hypothetical protein
MKKTPPVWLIKTIFLVFLPFWTIWIIVSVVGSEMASALHSIYLEFRVEIASAREQWRKLS